MGMVVDGRWRATDDSIRGGRFVRRPSAFAGRLQPETVAGLAEQPGRYHLITSLSCPWSHRTTIVRNLKGLADSVPLHVAHGQRIEGYPLAGGQPWTVPGTGRTIRHLHELYTLSTPAYTGRATVPVLWDSVRRRIVSNESADIVRGFDMAPSSGGASGLTLRPAMLSADIDAINGWIYRGLANGVYRAGFAETQSAYDEAIAGVFATLDRLEARLSGRRYLMGEIVTEADWLLFPTLVRFDAIYFVLHRCSLRRLTDYDALWGYARDLFTWRGVAPTVDFTQMREGSYRNDTANNPHAIVAVAPAADWSLPHGREALGGARIALADGSSLAVEPSSFAAGTAQRDAATCS